MLMLWFFDKGEYDQSKMTYIDRPPQAKSEIRVLQSVLGNALADLESGEYPITGRLCDDIARLGYAQYLAVDSIFNVRKMAVRRRLASRVCESCVSWLDCNEKVLGTMPMDEKNPFMIFEEDRTVSDQNLVPIVTRTMRYYR